MVTPSPVPLPRAAAGTAPSVAPSDAVADVLAVAWAPGCAPPREIRVRPELYQRLDERLCERPRPAAGGAGLLGVPLVVDPELPRAPGFEVRRVPPGSPVGPRAARPASPAA